MKQIEDAINIVKESLESGLASMEVFAANGHNPPGVRYFICKDGPYGDHQYVGIKEGNEPAEVSIARRLLKGNLNLNMVSQHESVSPKMIDLLKKMEDLRLDAGFRYGTNDLDIGMADTMAKRYTKQVDVYMHTVPLSDDQALQSLVSGKYPSEAVRVACEAARGDDSAIRLLDRQGKYEKAYTLTVPDTFDDRATLNKIFEISSNGRNNPLDANIKCQAFNGRDLEGLKLIGQSAVLRMDGKDFVSRADGIQEFPMFKGGPRKGQELQSTGPGL